jgi:hypothetical protein
MRLFCGRGAHFSGILTGMRTHTLLSIFAFATYLAAAQELPQAPSPQHPAPVTASLFSAVQESSTKLVAVSPSVALISGTKKQQLYTGSAILSDVRSAFYCDARTRQIGVLGSASDSRTKSETTPATVLVSDEAGVDFLSGMPGHQKYDDTNPKNKDAMLTQNFLALSADYFLNNSLGIGLQQEYTLEYQRYLRSCKPGTTPHRFFSSVGVGIGYANQRLYKTPSTVQSVITPLSGQFSYIWPNGKRAPKAILSAQIGFTPFPSDLGAYQIYENASLQLPTQWRHLTISLTQMDLYVNNAPTGFKRNYQSGGIQFTISNATPPPPTAGAVSGACYTADRASHLYCYDAFSQSACVPPSVFRASAHCSAPGGIGLEEQQVTPTR